MDSELREAIWRYENELDAIIHRANVRQEYWHLGGGDGPAPLAALEKALKRAQARVRELRTHEHRWNDDDYCDICGKDGRA